MNAMVVKCFALGQMHANCYLLSVEDVCILIDPCDEADFLISQISKDKLTLHALLATHGHFDHIMAAGEIQLSFPVPFYISEADTFLLKRVVSTALKFLGPSQIVIPPVSIVDVFHEKMNVPFNCEVITLPGHTPGSVGYYFKKEKAFFCGDIITEYGLGRTDFSYSDKQLFQKSVEYLKSLPSDVIIYPGHGDAMSVEDVRKW